MASVINRVTKEYITSVNEPNYPPEQWIIDPDLVALSGVPQKYWKIDGDQVLEMDQAKKDAVDAADLVSSKIQKAIDLDVETRDYIWSRYSAERQQSLGTYLAVALSAAYSMPNRAALIMSVLAWVETVLTYHFGIKASIDSAADLTALNAVTWDFDQFTASDPNVWIETVIGIVD